MIGAGMPVPVPVSSAWVSGAITALALGAVFVVWVVIASRLVGGGTWSGLHAKAESGYPKAA